MNYAKLLAEILPAILETGAFIRNEQRAFTKKDAEYKGKNDLVSYVDRTAEERLMTAFSKILPESGYINEESGVSSPDREFVWIIDPLDGTTNFVFDLPVYCSSIALRHGDRVVLGVVYDPVHEELFTAIAGQGAKMNNAPIRVSPTQTLASCLIATGFPFRRTGDMGAYLNLVGQLMTRTMGLRRMGSAAIDLAYTACGRFDAFYETHLKPWDVAAGVLLVQEAGGTVTQFDGQPYRLFDETLIASNNAIHNEMQHIINNFTTIDFPY